jgi:hypothetical protein
MFENDDRGVKGMVPLDRKTEEDWLRLSAMTQTAATGPNPCRVNEELRRAAHSEPQSPLAPAYLLWIAENVVREARYAESLSAFDAAVDGAHDAQRLLPTTNFIHVALHHKAEAAAIAGDRGLAIQTFQELAQASGQSDALFEAGQVAEAAGQHDRAAALYRAASGRTPSSSTEDPRELARRALMRMESADVVYARNAESLVDSLSGALTRHDTHELIDLASHTHFAVGPVGGELAFEEPDILNHLCEDLLDSDVNAQGVLGSGAKKYLMTDGWRGQWFRGAVTFVLTRSAGGWQWTGLGITDATENWRERWRPAQRQTNQPLPIPLLAPWPAQRSMTAGGLVEFGAQLATLLHTPPLFREVLALIFANNDCGFGPRGLYYNQPTTHQNVDAFSIDFTRYRRGVPFLHQSGGTPVLAPLGGVVVAACGLRMSGDPTMSNTVEIMHADPATGRPRFLTRYLHLAGPGMLSVSTGMAVITGQRLGLVNDTGNSVEDHLHFSVHDQTIPFPGVGPSACGGITRGASVRPTPLDGVALGDGASGTCITSTNVERRPGLNFHPASVNFGAIQVGAIGSDAFTIENTTGGSVTVSFPSSRPGNVFQWDAFNGVIPNGATRAVDVEFRPLGAGGSRTTLTVTSTAVGSPHRISIIGRGVGGAGNGNTSAF